MAGFRDALASMDTAIMGSLSDGDGNYFTPAGVPAAQAIALIVDHNLERAGAEGIFISDAVGITWNISDLATVSRGGLFQFGNRRYIVEDILADDGHMATAVCMEQT